jgi:hypothetical protein
MKLNNTETEFGPVPDQMYVRYRKGTTIGGSSMSYCCSFSAILSSVKASGRPVTDRPFAS